MASGDEWPDSGDFIVKSDGTPWHPDHVSERFEELVEAAELPPIRLHDLRHRAATYLKATGADLNDINETLGHSSITITSDTYTSVIQELETERAKADAAAALVPRAARTEPTWQRHPTTAAQQDQHVRQVTEPADTPNADRDRNSVTLRPRPVGEPSNSGAIPSDSIE
ncbi:tyrosine-type recombinase/integrase [Dactylosporangium sp. NPDC000521]|uniref:tyrosine-type recombinase/integrase n=1 Tax=Dactylosporangium sp. NPDC000521 TaxID=3363975 RepID=UPI0036B8A1D9